jgi:hypothetical protein
MLDRSDVHQQSNFKTAKPLRGLPAQFRSTVKTQDCVLGVVYSQRTTLAYESPFIMVRECDCHILCGCCGLWRTLLTGTTEGVILTV